MRSEAPRPVQRQMEGFREVPKEGRDLHGPWRGQGCDRWQRGGTAGTCSHKAGSPPWVAPADTLTSIHPKANAVPQPGGSACSFRVSTRYGEGQSV